MRTIIAALIAASASAVGSNSLAAQPTSIAQRVDAVRNGTVSMRFAARPGVCSNGNGSTWTRSSSTDPRDWRRDCVTGPVSVNIGRSDNETVSIRVSIGDNRRGTAETDLGVVSAPDAARFLLQVARGIGGRNATEAVSGAALADSVDLAPEFTALVRNAKTSIDARQQALYWLGQTSITTTGLANLYDGLEPFALREHFVFVISQRRDDPAVDKLIDIAGHDVDHEIRKRAMYWLGQTGNPRALKFLRDMVTR